MWFLLHSISFYYNFWFLFLPIRYIKWVAYFLNYLVGPRYLSVINLHFNYLVVKEHALYSFTHSLFTDLCFMANIMIYLSKFFVCTCKNDECNILQHSGLFAWQPVVVPCIFIFTNCLCSWFVHFWERADEISKYNYGYFYFKYIYLSLYRYN